MSSSQSTTSLCPSIFPKSTHPKQVLSADGLPRGPVRRPSQSMLMNTSAPSSKSMSAGVLKFGSASFKSDRWSHLRATGIGSRGRSLVIFFRMYASTPTFSESSSTPDTWNHTEPHVHVLARATPSTITFLFLRDKRRCCASRL